LVAPIRSVKVVSDDRRQKLKQETEELLVRHGLKLSNNPQLIIVLGGDGLFSYYARTIDLPLLFVGLRGKEPTASRAFLADIEYSELEDAIELLKNGRYRLELHPRLHALVNGKSKGTSMTDVYLEKAREPGCLRMRVEVHGPVNYIDFVIANGVIVTTPLGASGYYSYPDRISDDEVNVKGRAYLPRGSLGISYILPTYTLRQGSDMHPLRYSIPDSCTVVLKLLREGDARLYGVGKALRGYPVGIDDVVSITLYDKPAMLVRLGLERPNANKNK
jgi:hypothetical protein